MAARGFMKTTDPQGMLERYGMFNLPRLFGAELRHYPIIRDLLVGPDGPTILASADTF